MRDRLIELIESTRYWGSGTSAEIADYLLDNGVIVPPFAIGTKVYVPINSLSLPIPNAIYECEIQRYVMTTGGIVPVVKLKKGAVTYGDIHTDVSKLYSSREDAEKALRGGDVG